jgi:periplasmic copper chaperone A
LRRAREILLRLLCWAPLAAWALCSAAAEPASLKVLQAWVWQTPGTDMAAAYLTLRNEGTEPVDIVGMHSPIARRIMIHETKLEGGMSRMRPVGVLHVLPGQTVKLEPGGLHVMVEGLTQPLKIGQSVILVVELSDGSSVRASAQVRPLGGQ